MHFHIIRHGQTSANLLGQLSSMHGEVLNQTGVQQSRRLADHLASLDITDVWSSPLPRAIATIQPYCDRVSIRPTLLPELTEGQFNLDAKAGLSRYEAIDDSIPSEDEALEAFRGRVAYFIERVKREGGVGRVVVVTHGHFIREFLNLLLDAQQYVRWPIDNCGETLIEVSSDVFVHHVNRRVLL